MSLKPISFAGKILLFLAVGVASIVATSPRVFAQTSGSYYFTFSDPSANGYGTLQTTTQNDGSLWATSGSFTLTSSSVDDAPVGTYQLTPLGPSYTESPSGSGYAWDNLISSDGQLPGGIVFGSVGIWGSASDPEGFALSSHSAGDNSWTDHSGGSFSISAIPEPQTYSMLAGLGALGFVAYRRHRKQATPASR